jgi:DNA-binding XRE family transcriptional regulator
MAWRADRTDLDLDRLRAYFGKPYRQECGKRVQRKRSDMGLTQASLGQLIGVPFQTISKVENGEIDTRDYLKAALALRLGCPVEDLFPWPSRETLELVS